MTPAEFSAWIEFDALYPLDDHNRLYKPSALIAASMSGKYEERLRFLSPDPRDKPRALRMAEIVRQKE